MQDDPTAARRPTPTARRRVLLFALGQRCYALPVAKVAGLAASGPTRRIPGAPPGVRGLVEWRGHVLTVIDVPRLLRQDGGGPPCLVRLARPLDGVALFIPASLRMTDVAEHAGPDPDGAPVEPGPRFEHAGRPAWELDPQQLIQLVERQLREPV